MQRRTFTKSLTLLAGLGAASAGFSKARSDVRESNSDDHWAIQELLTKYCLLLDDGRHEDFAHLFAEDARFRAATLVYTGRDEIRRELAEKERRPGKHLAFPALIDRPSDDSALAWSDFLRVKTDLDTVGGWIITSIGRYHDRLSRIDGQWVFQTRDVYILGMENSIDVIPPIA